MELEICVDSVESAIAAANGGADRIELCSALSEGGITPSAGLIRAARAAAAIQLFVIIRPRGGNFVYSDRELDVMRADICEAKMLKVDGVALGVLTPENTVDTARTTELVQLAHPLEVTFHRAFDECRDVDRALEDVIRCGAGRILTSGGNCDAMNGVEAIAALERKARNRIRIMAGGGIRLSNVGHIVQATGIRAIHTSLNTQAGSTTHKGGAAVNGLNGGFARFVVREGDVCAFRSALNVMPAGS